MATEVVKVPAERDLEVYRLVAVEGRSTHAVADLFRISQTRVCQLIERVPGMLRQGSAGEEIRLQIAKERSPQLHILTQVMHERLEALRDVEVHRG